MSGLIYVASEKIILDVIMASLLLDFWSARFLRMIKT